MAEVIIQRILRLLERIMGVNLVWEYVKRWDNIFDDLLSRSMFETAEAPEFPRTIPLVVRQITEGEGRRTMDRELESLA